MAEKTIFFQGDFTHNLFLINKMKQLFSTKISLEKEKGLGNLKIKIMKEPNKKNLAENYLKAYLKPREALCHIYDLDSSHEIIILSSIEKVESLTGAYVKASDSCLFIYGVNNDIISDAVACFDEIIVNIKNLNFFPNESENKQTNKSNLVQKSSSSESHMSVDFHEDHSEIISKLSDTSCYIVPFEELDHFNDSQENSVELMDVDCPVETKEISIISIHSSENEGKDQTKLKKKKKKKKKSKIIPLVGEDITSPSPKQSTPKVQDIRCKSASPYILNSTLNKFMLDKSQSEDHSHHPTISNSSIIPDPPTTLSNANIANRSYFKITRTVNQVTINNYKIDNNQTTTTNTHNSIQNNQSYVIPQNFVSYDVRQHQSTNLQTNKPFTRSSSNSPPIFSKHHKSGPTTQSPPKALPTTYNSPRDPPTTKNPSEKLTETTTAADFYKVLQNSSHTSKSSNITAHDVRNQKRLESPVIIDDTSNHPSPPLPSSNSSRLPQAPCTYEHEGRQSIARSLPGSHLRHIVVDGSNVAMNHGRNKVFSCMGIKLVVDYFVCRGHKVTVFVPQWRRSPTCYRTPYSNLSILEDLFAKGHLAFTPSRKCGSSVISSYDDRYILKLAMEEDGIVISNDQYQDLYKETCFKNTILYKVLQVTFIGDKVMFPDDPLGRNGPNLQQFLTKPVPMNRLRSQSSYAR